MRFSQLPIVAGLKLFWDRVTFSRLTKIYFIFSVLHCIVQVVFQVQAFVANAEAARFLGSLIEQGNATNSGFVVYNGDLRMCEQVPNTLDASDCTLVWEGNSSASSNIPGQNWVSQASAAAAQTPTSSVTDVPPAVESFSAAPSLSTLSSSSLVSSTASATISASAASSASDVTTAVTTVSGTRTTLTVSATPSAKVNLQEPEEVESESSDSDSASNDEESDEESDDEAEEEEEEPVQLVNFSFGRRDFVLSDAKVFLETNGTAKVNLEGLNGLNEIELSRKCLYTLNWPADIVENTKREDIAFIAFQFWLLGMSLVALLNESIPHIVASLLTHIMATAWGAFQIYNTEVFHRKFTTLTTRGACGINLLPEYWKSRSNAEIPSMALNCFALLVSAFLSWRLMKTFGWQTFKRVGASRTINRVYNLVLMLSIAIQLSLFFVGASAALWVDQVCNGNIGRLTHEPHAFKAVMITVLVLLIPWLVTGWISVRKEYRIRMMIFLAVAVLILGGWASMFIAPTFRWTYATWLFFSLMTTLALVLTIATLVLGTVCRVNFGKGLTRYLNAQEELTDSHYSADVEKTYDSEKFAFPSPDSTPPTFSVTFGSGQEGPPPSQMRFSPRNKGPRFQSGTTLASDTNPFVTPTETTTNSLRSGSPTSTSPRSGSPTSSQVRSATPVLSRNDSRSSQLSASSTNSAGSSSSKSSNTRRWVIE